MKAIWTALGVAPAILAITGTMMWWHRAVKPKQRQLSTATAEGTQQVSPDASVPDNASEAR